MEQVEVKLAFLEQHLLELDGVVRALGDDIRRLRSELADLSNRDEGEVARHEKPPHY